MTQFGVPLFGRELFGFSGDSAEAEQFINPYLYQIELYSATSKIAPVLHWISGKWEQTANLPSLLVFTVSMTDINIDNFKYPNRIVLRDENGDALEWFCITSVSKQNSIAGARLVVSCQSLLWVLSFQYVSEFTKTATNNELIADLLAKQVNSFLPSIVLGDIDSLYGEMERNLYLKNTSVLRGILDLRKSAGGWLYVDANSRLNWKVEYPNKRLQQLRVDKNLTSIEFEYDYSEIRTKLTGNTSNELTYTVENNVDLYGEIPDVVFTSTIKDLVSLQALMEVEIAKRSIPKKTINCTAIDLSYYRGQLDFSHERLALGNISRLVDATINEVHDTKILKITRDLSVPHVVTIELGDADVDKDILDRLLETEDKVKEADENIIDFEDIGLVEVPISGDDSEWYLDPFGPLIDAIKNTFRGDEVQLLSSSNIIGNADEWARVDHRHALPHGEDDPDDPEAKVDLSAGPVNDNAPVYLMGDALTGYSLRVWGGTLGWRKIWYLKTGVDAPEDPPDIGTLHELPLYLQRDYGQPSILWKWKLPVSKDMTDIGTGEWVPQKEIIEKENTSELPEVLHDGQTPLALIGKYGYIYDVDAPSGESKWTCFTHYLGNV